MSIYRLPMTDGTKTTLVCGDDGDEAADYIAGKAANLGFRPK
jgi:hypothetical protein